jgi:hypothetical protein
LYMDNNNMFTNNKVADSEPSFYGHKKTFHAKESCGLDGVVFLAKFYYKQ